VQNNIVIIERRAPTSMWTGKPTKTTVISAKPGATLETNLDLPKSNESPDVLTPKPEPTKKKPKAIPIQKPRVRKPSPEPFSWGSEAEATSPEIPSPDVFKVQHDDSYDTSGLEISFSNMKLPQLTQKTQM
jgi:hypothetical protein